MNLDSAFFSKPIPNTSNSSDDLNWNLVFTKSGKYFFHDPQTGQRSWIPPQNVLKALKEKFTPTQREMFFDPFYQEDEEREEELEVEEEEKEEDTVDKNESILNIENVNYSKNNSKYSEPESDSNSTAEDEFKLYLLKHSIDPFAPWPTIQSLHSTSPQFQAIASEKRRQDLFAQVCQILIQMHREEAKKKLEEAKEWWKNVLNNSKNEMNWFQLLKKIKGNPKFKMLNEKECEKEFRTF